MDNTVQKWLDGYVSAWRSNDPDEIRALFTEDGTYAGSPLQEKPVAGVDNIVAWWLKNKDDVGEWTFEAKPIAFSDGVGVIEGYTVYGNEGHEYANLWVVHFAEDGRATSFVEWALAPGH